MRGSSEIIPCDFSGLTTETAMSITQHPVSVQETTHDNHHSVVQAVKYFYKIDVKFYVPLI